VGIREIAEATDRFGRNQATGLREATDRFGRKQATGDFLKYGHTFLGGLQLGIDRRRAFVD
jgi:hypothetical protein